MKQINFTKLNQFLTSSQFAFIHDKVQLVTMFFWIFLMTYSRSYYVIYLLMGIFGFYCRYATRNNNHDFFSKEERPNLIVAAVFSLVILAANYDMYYYITDYVYDTLTIHNQFAQKIPFSQFREYEGLIAWLCIPILFLGGTYLTMYILRFVTELALSFRWKVNSYQASDKKVFLSVFFLIGGFYLLILLLGFLPGFFCPDTLNQVSEILSGEYSNTNPFYHTMYLRFYILIGVKLFHNINIGAALYSVSSVLFMSSAFAYAAVTLYQLRINKKIILALTLFYMLMPHYILFSFNMWKDTPFSAFVLLFTVSTFRYLKEIGINQKLNYAMVIFSGMGVCLFRGNGLIVLFISIIAFAVLFRRSDKKMLLSLTSVLAVALIMSYPLLRLLHVSQSDVVELSSMPIQQITRTLRTYDDLTDEQRELISKVADIEQLKSQYMSFFSDPLKNYIRSNGGSQYISEHKAEYAKLYIQLGLKHPDSYAKAWVDQTKGYWNGGYRYVRFSFAFSDNNLGLKRTMISDKIEKVLFLYCALFEIVELLRPFISIGLHTWLIFLAGFIGYRKRDKAMIFSAVPCLAIIFSLLLGTPVFAEYRYAYGLFCCLPFLAVAVFSGSKEETGTASSSESERKQA